MVDFLNPTATVRFPGTRDSRGPMCGIVGWLSWGQAPRRDIVEAMTDRLVHRGPDAGAVVTTGPIAFGHRRLSIIDLSASANQPMWDESGQYLIVFNGEIYNFKDVKRDLQARGARFRTQGDTEVILEAYKSFGLDFLRHLNGMFAFALWDDRQKTLVLARDRLGEKPLYYCDDGAGGLIFASELKALRAHPAFSLRIDPQALAQYLAFNYTLEDACFAQGVRKLAPATFLVIGPGGTSGPQRYWDLASAFRNKPRHPSEKAAAEMLADMIDRSVRGRMISDVPLGAFLSGGIDSSTIAAAVARTISAGRTKTFSIGFREDTFSEVVEARSVANFLGVDHHDLVVDVDMARDLPRIVHYVDEPMADTSMIPMFYLARFARNTVSVCLSGDGGDEILGGYETYAADRLRALVGWLPRGALEAGAGILDRLWSPSFAKVGLDYKAKQFLRGAALDPDRAHVFWRMIFGRSEAWEILRPDHREALLEADVFAGYLRHSDEVAGCHYLDRAMYVDLKTWLPSDILVKVDRTTMAHSLECRAPFLDHELVEFCAGLPVDWKLKGLRKKHLLKMSQAQRLPAEVLTRRKLGFNAPVSHWLAGDLSEMAREACLSAAMTEWFDRGAVRKLWDEHLRGSRDHGYKLFGLTCLGLWLAENGPISSGH